MKFAITTAALLLVFGTAASTHAQEKNQEHHEGSKPEQQQHQQSKPAQQQSKPAEHQQAQQHSQPAARSQQQSHSESHAQNNNNHGQTQSHSEQAHNNNNHGNVSHGNENHSDHGRISNAHYQSNFGREHSFHVNRAEYDRHRFVYGGYTWGFVDPWPVAWGYSDDVYVIYADGGYYMYNRFHPGVRIAININ